MPAIENIKITNEKAINKRMLGGQVIPTKFEDMYPFLPVNEIKKSML